MMLWFLYSRLLVVQALVWPLAFQGRGQTLSVRHTQAGLRFFVFEGMRFIVKDGKLQRASLTVGDTYMDLHQVTCQSCTCLLGLI